MEKSSNKITGLVLCGGKGSRLNYQNKGLINLKNRPLVLHQVDLLQDFCLPILINNNDQIEQYQQLGLKSLPDELKGFVGPLAGIHTGLVNSKTNHVLVVAVDYPFIKKATIQKLINVSNLYPNTIIAAHYQGRHHPLVAIFPTHLEDKIAEYLEQGGRRVLYFLQKYHARYIDCSGHDSVEFININNPEQLNKL